MTATAVPQVVRFRSWRDGGKYSTVLVADDINKPLQRGSILGFQCRDEIRYLQALERF